MPQKDRLELLLQEKKFEEARAEADALLKLGVLRTSICVTCSGYLSRYARSDKEAARAMIEQFRDYGYSEEWLR